MADTFAGELGIDEMRCPDCGTQSLEFPINQSLHCDRCGSNFYDAETFEAQGDNRGDWPDWAMREFSQKQRDEYDEDRIGPVVKVNGTWTWCNKDSGVHGHVGEATQAYTQWSKWANRSDGSGRTVNQGAAYCGVCGNSFNAETFEAPYAGPGATMDIGKDTALSSFTPEELTTSSAIHGDFDQASLDYSGHQNIEVRAEDAETYKCKDCGGPVVEVLKYAEGYGKRQRFGNRYVARNTQGEFISNVGVGASLKADRRNKSKTPASSGFGNKGDSQKTPPTWAKPLGYVGALAAGWISASMIDKAKE
jgi:predicted Zn-ribbon and HTH transcriptional regulator